MRYPNISDSKMIPHNALIILRYVSWGKFFKKNFLPDCFAAQAVSYH